MKYKVIKSRMKEDHLNYTLVDEKGFKWVTGTKGFIIHYYINWNGLFEDEPMLPLDNLDQNEELIQKYDHIFPGKK